MFLELYKTMTLKMIRTFFYTAIVVTFLGLKCWATPTNTTPKDTLFLDEESNTLWFTTFPIEEEKELDFTIITRILDDGSPKFLIAAQSAKFSNNEWVFSNVVEATYDTNGEVVRRQIKAQTSYNWLSEIPTLKEQKQYMALNDKTILQPISSGKVKNIYTIYRSKQNMYFMYAKNGFLDKELILENVATATFSKQRDPVFSTASRIAIPRK